MKKALFINVLLYVASALGVAAIAYNQTKKARRLREEKERQRVRVNDGWNPTFFEHRAAKLSDEVAKRGVPCESPNCPACRMRNEMLHRDAVRHSPNN